MQGKYRAVFWDFGGVVTTSPFERFNELENRLGAPRDFVRRVNATDIHDNAWARLERGDVDRDGFAELFRRESAALGHEMDGHLVLECLAGGIRDGMVEALLAIRDRGLLQACLTNNVRPEHAPGEGEGGGALGESAGGWTPDRAMALFDLVVESSVEGVRKPEQAFYERALERARVRPEQVVYLDDLGINLKPARAMGMTTIKVVAERQALDELQGHLGFSLGGDSRSGGEGGRGG